MSWWNLKSLIVVRSRRSVLVAACCVMLIAVHLVTAHARHILLSDAEMSPVHGMVAQVSVATTGAASEQGVPAGRPCPVPAVLARSNVEQIDVVLVSDIPLVADGATLSPDQASPRAACIPRPAGPTRQALLQQFRL